MWWIPWYCCIFSCDFFFSMSNFIFTFRLTDISNISSASLFYFHVHESGTNVIQISFHFWILHLPAPSSGHLPFLFRIGCLSVASPRRHGWDSSWPLLFEIYKQESSFDTTPDAALPTRRPKVHIHRIILLPWPKELSIGSSIPFQEICTHNKTLWNSLFTLRNIGLRDIASLDSRLFLLNSTIPETPIWV